MIDFRDMAFSHREDMRPVSVYNIEESEAAIPYAAMQIRGFQSSTGALQVSRPLADNMDSQIVFNGPCPIPPLSEGQAFAAMPGVAAYQENGQTPAPGEFWGTKFNSWQLHRDRYGFVVLGGGSDIQTVAVMFGHSQFIKPIHVPTTATISEQYTTANEAVYDTYSRSMGSYADVFAHDPNRPGQLLESGYYLGILAGQWRYKKIYLCLCRITGGQAQSMSSSSGNSVTLLSNVWCDDEQILRATHVCLQGSFSVKQGPCGG